MKLLKEIKSQIKSKVKSNHKKVINQVKMMMASQMGYKPVRVHQTHYVENGRAMNISDVQYVLANLR